MDFELLLIRCRELRLQRSNVYERLTTEQAMRRRQFVVKLYCYLKSELEQTDELATANFLQHIINDIINQMRPDSPYSFPEFTLVSHNLKISER